MDIVIKGEHGVGKSNMADIIRNTIFKMDEDATVITDDPSRETKTFGHGKNIYHIIVTLDKNYNQGDIVINIQSDAFKKWYDKN